MEDNSRKEMVPLNEKDLEEVSGGSDRELTFVPFKTNVSADTTPAENSDVKAGAGFTVKKGRP